MIELHRWGGAVNFALLSPLILQVFWLPANNLRAMIVAPGIHRIFADHGVVWNLWVLVWCELWLLLCRGLLWRRGDRGLCIPLRYDSSSLAVSLFPTNLNPCSAARCICSLGSPGLAAWCIDMFVLPQALLRVFLV
jgi:hypothetical protein